MPSFETKQEITQAAYDSLNLNTQGIEVVIEVRADMQEFFLTVDGELRVNGERLYTPESLREVIHNEVTNIITERARKAWFVSIIDMES